MARAIKHWEANAPREICDTLSRFSDAINAPHIGVFENYMWPAGQLNIAPAQDGNSCTPHLSSRQAIYRLITIFHKGGTLSSSMSVYGCPHTDHCDCPVSFSFMQDISELPEGEGWQGGRFHLLALGFYVKLVRWRIIYFSGRLRHGGTAPLAPIGQTAPKHAFRVVLIGYPPQTMIEGNVCHALAAMPHTGEPLWLSPEMTGIM